MTQLGDIEQGGQDADHGRIDPDAADPLEMGQVIGQQGTGQAGAQAQGERSKQDGRHRTPGLGRLVGRWVCPGGGWIHARQAYKAARGRGAVRRVASTGS